MGRALRLAGVAVLALFWLVPAIAGAAESDYVGQPVGSVRVTLNGQADQDPQVLGLIVTRIGSPLTAADVRETIEHLMSLGRFLDVRVSAAASASGVALTYELVPRREITQIRFEGRLGLSSRELRTAITDRFGPAPPAARIADAVRVVHGLYADHGYLSAVVTPKTVGAGDEATLVFHVDAGRQARIAAIRIAGSPIHLPASIIERLSLRVGERYDRLSLIDRIGSYVDELKAAGYYEASVQPSIVPGETPDTVALTLTIDPGPHVTLAFDGDRLPASQEDDLVPVKREGSADEDLLEDSARNIQEYLQARGYRDPKATFSRDQQGNELKVVFHVTRGLMYRIAGVQLSGSTIVPLESLPSDLQPRAGQPFVQARLDATVAALQLRYRELGYSNARIDPAVRTARRAGSDGTDDGGDGVPVTVTLAVQPGIRTIVDDVALVGNRKVPGAALRNALGVVPGQPFYGPAVARDRDALQLLYATRGYESATVTPQLGFSGDRSRVAVRYVITEGPQIFVEHVLIVGNTRTSTSLIRRELRIAPGDPMNVQALTESQRRLVALGLFRRVQVTELRHGSSTHRDVLVSVEEAPATTIAYGGGLEVGMRPRAAGDTGAAIDRLEVAPRALFEITRSNLFGKNRSISLFSRVSLRPNSAPFNAGTAGPANGTGSYGFSDYRLIGTYREPRLFGTASDAVVTGVMEQGVRASFNFAHRGASVQLARRISRTLSFSGNYAIDRNKLFDVQVSPADQLLIDRLFPQVRLSSVSASLVHDTRDDAINPTHGSLMVANGQLAGRAIGSEVGFAKSFLQASMYRPLPGFPKVVFASDARLGLAAGFPRRVEETDSQGQPVTGPDGQPLFIAVRDLPASERFFAGGDTTVRGFALDQLGTPATIDANGFPIGGDGLVILNAELRVPVWRGLGVVGFLDAGNVFAHVADLDPAEIRAAAGFGLRYQSPIGPIRIDLGFKLSRRELTPGRLEPLTALNISLGQAF